MCAIWVRSDHFVPMYGLALYVNTDLRQFGYIQPGGCINKGGTSIAREVGHEVPMEEVCARLEKELHAVGFRPR